MCHHCVIESVKDRMLSRRELFKGAAAGAAAVAVSRAPSPARAMSHGGGLKDLTHELYEDFPTYFGERQLEVTPKFTYDEHKFNLNVLTVNEHTGTHMDAPLHFSQDGQSVAEIPVERLMAPLAIVDIASKAEENPDAQVTPDDLKAWVSANGEFPENCCVAMHSGWGRHVASDMFRNVGPDEKMHFPGFHVEAAQMLMDETEAIGMAVDTLSLDYGMSDDFATHYAWLPTNRWGLENVANLDQLPATGATMIVGAPKHRGGTGGPARVLALM